MAVLKDGVDKDELFFIIGWLLTSKCNEILKNVINHTKNIQSKDIERLPYPFWVSDENKKELIGAVKAEIINKKKSNTISSGFIDMLNRLYE